MTPKTIKVLRSNCPDSEGGKFRVHLDEKEWEALCSQFQFLESERARLDAMRANFVHKHEMLLNCQQDTVCANPPGCMRHWAERNQELAQEVKFLTEIKRWLESIADEFERTIAHADWKAAGSKGMSVPFHGDFASAVQLPSVISRMRWWAREFKTALGPKP